MQKASPVFCWLLCCCIFSFGTQVEAQTAVPATGLRSLLAHSTTRENSGILERVATWFSGVVYLNPRFGWGQTRTAEDWEAADLSLVHQVSPTETHLVSKSPPDAKVSGREQDAGEVSGRTQATLQNTVSSSRDVKIKRSHRHAHTPVLEGQNNTSAGQIFPKVALMFLTRGAMPYEATWQAFLEGVPSNIKLLNERHTDFQNAGWKRMFTLYVHPSINYTYSSKSLFSDKVIAKLERVEWGQWGVMQAERNLVEAALEDKLNERFVLLSESCIPLYPATLTWAQLLSEPRSRIHACSNMSDPGDENRRMIYRMQNMEKQGLKREHWRKSGQWVALNRKHAQLVIADTLISQLFKDECWVDAEHLAKGEPLWRFCVSDEHYLPTLLAFHGLEHETDCKGSVTNAWWEGPYFHPKTWGDAEVSLELIAKLRKTNNGFDPQSDLQCPSAAALESIRTIFSMAVLSLRKNSRHSRRLMQQASQHSIGKHWSAGNALKQQFVDLLYKDVMRTAREPMQWQSGSNRFWMYLAGFWNADGKANVEEHMLTQSRQLSQIDVAAPTAETQQHWEAAKPLLSLYKPMIDGGCPLFARKFAPSGADRTAGLAHAYTSLRQTVMPQKSSEQDK